MINEYRIATDEEKQGRCSKDYDLLIGPNGFECVLGEPEDRIWCRDGRDVVNELNRLHRIVQELTLRGLPIKLKNTQLFTRD